MKNTKLILTLILVLMGVAFFVPARAEEAQPEQMIAVATVNLYDARIISQDKNNFQLTMLLTNREQVQPDVRYAVQLMQVTDKGQNIVDTQVYDEVLSLGVDAKVQKEFAYTAPAFLQGQYQLLAEAMNSQGLPLGYVSFGEVTLAGDGQFIDLSPEKCKLTIVGDTQNTQYDLTSGVVGMEPKQELQLNCTLANNFSQPVSATPVFKVFYRSVFGETILEEKLPAIALSANDKNALTALVPMAKQAQIYAVRLVLQDETNKNISNALDFQYLVTGNNATIQNVRLDKDAYQPNDTAKLSFYWGGFVEGPMTVKLALQSQAGQACAQPVTAQIETKDGFVQEYAVPIENQCQNPQVMATMTDANGKVLAQTEFTVQSQNAVNVETTDAPVVQPDVEATSRLPVMLKWLIASGVLVSALIVLLLSMRRKNRAGLKTVVFAFCLLGGLAVSQGVRADTFAKSVHFVGTGTQYCDTTFNVNVGMNSTLVLSGGLLTATAQATLASSGGCWLKWGFGGSYTHRSATFYPKLMLSASTNGITGAFSHTGHGFWTDDYSWYISDGGGIGGPEIVNSGSWMEEHTYPMHFGEFFSKNFTVKTITGADQTQYINFTLSTPTDFYGTTSVWSLAMPYTVMALNPPTIPTITGPTAGLKNTSYSFSVNATDPDNDALQYLIEWYDAANQYIPAYNGYFSGGIPQIVTHSWATTGLKTFKVRASDIWWTSSAWASHTINITDPPICPADCTAWSAWNTCSVNCGSGTQTKTCTSANCLGFPISQPCDTGVACRDLNWREVSPND